MSKRKWFKHQRMNSKNCPYPKEAYDKWGGFEAVSLHMRWWKRKQLRLLEKAGK